MTGGGSDHVARGVGGACPGRCRQGSRGEGERQPPGAGIWPARPPRGAGELVQEARAAGRRAGRVRREGEADAQGPGDSAASRWGCISVGRGAQ